MCIFLAAMTLTAIKASREYDGFYIKNSAKLSDKIRDALKNRSYAFTVSFDACDMDADKVKDIVDTLLEGALYESEDPKGGDYIRYQLGGYEMEYTVKRNPFGYSYRAHIIPAYYTNREEEEFVDHEIAQILSGFKDAQSDREKIRAAHDFVTELLSYDSVHKENAYSHKKTTAYAALKYHRAVCQGYAVLTYRLLKELGIDCRIVTGDAYVLGNRERHAWLVVQVGGEELGLDPTLDDVNESHDWYLKPLSEFEKDHVRQR